MSEQKRRTSPPTAKEHRTASRVTTIPELAEASRSGVRLTELAAALNAPRSSAHGLVEGLVATGYLQDKAGACSLGPAIRALLGTEPRPIGPARHGGSVPTIAEAVKAAASEVSGRLAGRR